jgi:hypothetical protein
MVSLEKADFRAWETNQPASAPAAAGHRFGVAASVDRGWFRLPAAAQTRLWLLFFALAMIKVIIISRLSKHLYEIHWRVETPGFTWLNSIAFGTFTVLGAWSLVRLGYYCRGAGLKAVRAANTAVLGLGLAFIFLTFHTGERNYLYPILTHVLKWTSLGPYLSLDCFFRAPYLAAWLFGYAAIYYFLVRTGREPWTIYLTAFAAGAYGLTCLQELRVYRNELLIVDCLGLVPLVLTPSACRKVRVGWLLGPIAWTLFFWLLLLKLALPLDGASASYFVLLLGICVLLLGSATLAARKYGFLAPWSNFVLFYFAALLLFADANYPMAVNYNNLLCLALEFPRYFIGELLVLTFIGLATMIYCRWRPKAGLWWLDILNLALLAVAFVDLRLSQIMGVRLQWDVLEFANSPKMMWRMAKPYLPGAAAAAALALLGYALLLRAIRRRAACGEPSENEPTSHGLRYVTACFIGLALLGLAVANADKAEGTAALALTSPLWKRAAHRTLDRDQFVASATALGLWDLREAWPLPPSAPPNGLNVLLVFMESSYNTHLSLFGGSEETQPLLSKYKERMELFPNFFSAFAGSIQARFATFTSLYPVRDFNAFTLHRVGVKSIFEVLQENDYHCSLFYSSFFDYTGFGDFLKQRGIEELYDADNMPGQRTTQRVSWGLREEETLGAIRSQIKKYASRQQRFFLTYVPAAPHYPYDCIPKEFRKFKQGEVGDFTPLYLNELLYMDWVLASIVDQLKESGLLDTTLVIITNDHGEKTGAHGDVIGHGWMLTPDLANTPLILMDPRKPGYHLNYTLGSQVDLLPTVLDRLGIPLPADQFYQGYSLDVSHRPADRVMYLNTYQQFGIVAQDRFIFGDRQTDQNRGAALRRTTYSLHNQDSKTLFQAEPATPGEPVSIAQFDEFQENLLQNYSAYRASLLLNRTPMAKSERKR